MTITGLDRRPGTRWAATEWSLWSTTARLVVEDPALLAPARRLVDRELAAVDRAASRFRDDSEVMTLARSQRRTAPISALLADLVEAALDAAWLTDGLVDPMLGGALRDVGYTADISELPAAAVSDRLRDSDRDRDSGDAVECAPAHPDFQLWRKISLERLGRAALLTVPAGALLDLGATAKAVTADRCAALVARTFGCGTLVGLGGDLATAGPAPDGWRITVQDTPDDPAATVGLPAGAAMATSSTVRRRWRHRGRTVHHLLDPRTHQPTATTWRSVTVASGTCWHANTLCTAAIVHGPDALAWLAVQGRPARLVGSDGEVHLLNGWPAEAAAPAPAAGHEPRGEVA